MNKEEKTAFINHQKNLLRPLNFPKNTPGSGAIVFTTKNHKKI
jgi:calcineurin-like phosphoesterase